MGCDERMQMTQTSQKTQKNLVYLLHIAGYDQHLDLLCVICVL